MNILAIVGSPRRRGNTSTIIETICEAAGEAGHECDIQHIYDYDLNGCRACGKCKSGEVELCAQDDDMAELLLRVINSDCLIFGSPVYMGQVTGPAKTFLDRFYAFSTKGFGVRYLEGKKLITVITCGAPAEKYKSVEEYLHRWLGEFYKMELVGSVMAGELSGGTDLSRKILNRASEIGQSL